MVKKANREFWQSAEMNNASFAQYYNRLVELSMSMFEWKNLPPSIDKRFLELTLFSSGQAVFFKDEELDDYLALRCLPMGQFNVYGIPEQREAFGYNGYHKQVNNKDSVIIYNNMLRLSSRLDVEMFARRLYDIDRTIDVNVKAQKTPILIRCEENQKLSMLNIYKNYDGNAPVIYAYNDMTGNPLSVIKTDAPYNADKLYRLKTDIWNEALTYLGISNINVNKKERLISDEVERGQGGVIASRFSRLNTRQMACDEINRMFGLNISCDYKEIYSAKIDDNNDEEIEKEVIKNE